MKTGKRTITRREKWLGICIGIAALSFVAAAAVYFVMLHIEKEALAVEETVSVWVLREPVEKNRSVSRLEMESLAAPVQYPSRFVPQDAVREGETLPEGRALCRLDAGTVLCGAFFEEENRDLKAYDKPVIATVEVTETAGVVGGILRRGDRVNLYMFQQDLEVGRYENVLVQEVFDAGQTAIAGEDEESPAARFNVYLEEREAGEFYRVQQDAKVRAVKVLKKE